MVVNGVTFDRQRILHDIASLYAKHCIELEYPSDKPEPSPQEFARSATEVYCTMLGLLQTYDNETLSDFIRKEMP